MKDKFPLRVDNPILQVTIGINFEIEGFVLHKFLEGFMGKELMEVKVMGIVVDPKASNPVVVLVDISGQKALPIWIGVFEAEAISRGLEDAVTLRPMTHDLMKQILDTFQATLSRVVIHDIKENTFYANLYLNIEGKEIIVDSRPSDAIALAVRVKAPIFIAESVVEVTKQLGLFASNLLEEQDELKTIIESMKPEDFGKFKM
jgi:bifunctional DNase/RNase